MIGHGVFGEASGCQSTRNFRQDSYKIGWLDCLFYIRVKERLLDKLLRIEILSYYIQWSIFV